MVARSKAVAAVSLLCPCFSPLCLQTQSPGWKALENCVSPSLGPLGEGKGEQSLSRAPGLEAACGARQESSQPQIL